MAERIDKIHCKFHLALETKDKATRHVLKRLEQYDIAGLTVEEYHKFPGTFMASFIFSIESASVESSVCGLLRICNKLSRSSWTVNGPFEHGDLSFGCCLNNENKEDPLRWAYLSIGDA